MQQSPSTSLPQDPTTTQTPPKIHPLIQTRENSNDELSLQRSLKLYSKASRQAKFITNPTNLRSQTFTKLLRAQNKPSTLQYYLGCLDIMENRLLFSQLKSLSSASCLKIILANHSQTNNIESIQGLGENLLHLKNLNTLDIKLQSLDLQDYEIMLRIIRSIRKIRTITFAISKCTNISQIHVDILTHYLKKMPQLKTLKLSFDASINPTATHLFHNLASLLRTLPSLTKLELSFTKFKNIPVSHISELLQSLKSLEDLQDLTLDLSYSETLSYHEQPLSTIFPYLALPSLRKLRLNFPRFLDDECLEVLSGVLKDLISLKNLGLDLIYCYQFTDKGVESLRLGLSSLTGLSSLALNLPVLFETQSILGQISATIQPLENLVKLDLKFKTKMIKIPVNNLFYQEIQGIFANVRALKLLQSFEIALPYEHELEDEAFEILAESLKELVSLKNLSLISGYPRKITNKGVEAIGHAIKSLPNLSSLALSIKFNKNIDEAALNLLGGALLNHPSLRCVNFTFVRCPNIENLESFGTLFEAVKQFKEPSEILLHFPRSKINGPEADYLNERKMLVTSVQLKKSVWG